MEIHQLVAGFDCGDAITSYALELRDIFRSWGYPSRIYGEHINPALRKYCLPYPEHRERSAPENIAILHFSIGSENSKYFADLVDKKVMIYHNVTPPQFFQGFDAELAYNLKKGREELRMLKDIPHLALGDSEYNCGELRRAGYKNIGCLPIIIDFQKYKKKPRAKVIKLYSKNLPAERQKTKNFLSVGRIIPNKKLEDIVKVFYYYSKHIDSNSRLFLVGSYDEEGRYLSFLNNLIKKLGIKEKVILSGRVIFEELLAYYRLADIYLCLSEHEGFCIPLLESMFFGIPIIAYEAAAVPYTLNGAGVLFKEKNYEEIAELAHLLLTDRDLREKIVEKGKERLKDFAKERITGRLKEYIEKFL
jgi:glycosyltransferase involved in cell wall biosynthesis